MLNAYHTPAIYVHISWADMASIETSLLCVCMCLCLCTPSPNEIQAIIEWLIEMKMDLADIFTEEEVDMETILAATDDELGSFGRIRTHTRTHTPNAHTKHIHIYCEFRNNKRFKVSSVGCIYLHTHYLPPSLPLSITPFRDYQG